MDPDLVGAARGFAAKPIRVIRVIGVITVIGLLEGVIRFMGY